MTRDETTVHKILWILDVTVLRCFMTPARASKKRDRGVE